MGVLPVARPSTACRPLALISPISPQTSAARRAQAADFSGKMAILGVVVTLPEMQAHRGKVKVKLSLEAVKTAK
ncbi:MAG: hypothetical protein MUF31_00025 [Akkermansiaceae bacterium]|nr:hypothetical protein [Akkermansiaceae bacterium]